MAGDDIEFERRATELNSIAIIDRLVALRWLDAFTNWGHSTCPTRSMPTRATQTSLDGCRGGDYRAGGVHRDLNRHDSRIGNKAVRRLHAIRSAERRRHTDRSALVA